MTFYSFDYVACVYYLHACRIALFTLSIADRLLTVTALLSCLLFYVLCIKKLG